jgi:L-threonylcarbamoyladenylate synthase
LTDAVTGPISKSNQTPFTDEIDEAERCLRAGGVVAFPTDTLYGLGADVFNPAALNRVFAIKERTSGLALPVLIDSWSQLDRLTTNVPARARALADAFWPGPLTLVIDKAAEVPERLTAGAPTVAVRLPDHPVPRAILRRFGGPITGTSANLSGGPDPMTLAKLKALLGDRVDYIMTCGPAPQGIASTIVDITTEPPTLIREGAIPFQRVMKIWETWQPA